MSREELAAIEAQAALAHGLVEHAVALRLVDRADHALLEDLCCHPRDVECHEVRHQPHHGPIGALGEVHVAFDVDEAAQPRRAGVPEQAAFEQAAPEPAEVFAHEAVTHALREFGQTQCEVAQGDAAAAAREAPQHVAQATADEGLHGQRQPVQQPHQREQGIGGEVFATQAARVTHSATHSATRRGAL